jgi:ABC-type lipoprotein release transport system permease subunit
MATDVQQLALPGVKQILVRQHQSILLRSDKGIEPLVLIGVNPAQEKQAAAYWKKTVKGSFLGEKEGTETIYLSQETATRLNVDVGQSVDLTNRQGLALKTLTVTGLYKTGITHLDQGMALCSAQAMPTGEKSFSVAVFLQPDAPLEEIAAQYRKLLPAASFSTWTEFMPDLKQLIDLDYFCMAIVILLVFAIVSVGISCTFLIFTLKSLREHGIMKAMGIQSSDTALLLLSQIGLLTVSAAAIGTMVGALIVAIFSNVGIDISAYISHNQYFAVSGMLYPRLTGWALFAPPIVAVLFSLMAAVWPIAYVLRKNPADILRSV